MTRGISAQGSFGYNIPKFPTEYSLIWSGSSDSLSLTPLGALGGGDGVSTISSYCVTASAGLIAKFAPAR